MDLATTHLSADLDGLASLVAIRLLEGPLEIALPGSMDPTTRKFWTDHGEDLPPLLPLGEVRRRVEEGRLGRLIVVDTADPARIGAFADWLPRFDEAIAWDNHPPSPGDLPRAPMPEAGACVSGLVLRLREEGRAPSASEAGLFLLGIHMDTGHFTFAGTTPLDLEAARICLEWGAPQEWVGRYLPKGYTSRELQRLSQMASSVEHVRAGSSTAALMVLELPSYEPDLSILLEQLRAAEGWPSAFLLAGSGNRVDVIGRSDGSLDVGEVLRGLGGGGHREAASGALRSVTLREARGMVRQGVEEVAGRRRTAGEVAARPFVSIAASAPVEKAAERLRQRRIDSLPLTRGRGKGLRYVGLVGRREVDAAIAHGLGSRPVGELSLGPPPWVAPSAPIDEARRILVSGVTRLLLVGHPPGDALGVLTRGTVLRAMEEPALSRSSSLPGMERVRALAREGLGSRWELVERLGEVAEELGVGLHLVGGTVRDLLLGLPVHDVDLLVEGAAPRVAREAAKRFGGRVHVHEAFGTASWSSDEGERVDLASSRAEHYQELAALPSVELHAGLRQDLFRRDFTVNAMAISVAPGELGLIRDPFGGHADLQAGILRVLHGLSFHDDPTRAFRAARFAARFDFEPSPETLGLLHAARKAGAFDRLGKERLGVEIDRILGQSEVVQAFRLLRDWKLLPKIHPRFSGGRGLLSRIGSARDTRNRLAGSVEDMPPQADVLWIEVGASIPRADRGSWGRMVPRGGDRRRRFVWGAEKVRKAQARLAGARKPSDAARILEGLDTGELAYALATASKAGIARWIEWWLLEGRHIRPAVDGHALLRQGAPQGKGVGEALAAARSSAWNGEDREAQLAAAMRVLRRREGR